MKDANLRRKKLEKRVSRTLHDANPTKPKRPIRVTFLPGHTDAVWRVLPLPLSQLLVTASSDHNVRVYSMNSPWSLKHDLEMHTSAVYDLTALGDDVFASVGSDGRIVTWIASSGKMLDVVHLEAVAVISAEAIEHDCMVVGTAYGELIYLKHNQGRNLHKVARCRWAHSACIEVIASHGSIMVAGSHNNTASVWDIRSRRRLALLTHSDVVWDATVSDAHVATCTKNDVRVFARDGAEFPLVRRFRHDYNTALMFLGTDLLSIGDNSGIVSFVSITEANNIASVKAPFEAIRSLCAVSEDKMGVSSYDGKCAVVSVANIAPATQGLKKYFFGLSPSSSVVPHKQSSLLRCSTVLVSLSVTAVLMIMLRCRRQ